MSAQFELKAELRNDKGKGASRRLRRQGRVPAILYGAGKDPLTLSFEQNVINKQLEDEAFYSQILSIKIGAESEQVVLRDLHRHPFKPTIMHMDFQRVSADQKLRVHLPLHFINEDNCRGVKQEGGAISHLMIDVEITCLPKDLPEFIEVDVVDLGLGESIQLSELKLPEGVEIIQLMHGGEHDTAVVNVHHAHSAEEEEEEKTDAEEGVMDDSAASDPAED